MKVAELLFHEEPKEFTHSSYKKPTRIWEPVLRCGCGECRFKKARRCPLANSENAITLWASRPRG